MNFLTDKNQLLIFKIKLAFCGQLHTFIECKQKLKKNILFQIYLKLVKKLNIIELRIKMASINCFRSRPVKVDIKLHGNSDGKLVFYSGEKLKG